jgi:hypothetical protein
MTPTRDRQPALASVTVWLLLAGVTVVAWIVLWVLAGTDCGSDADPPSAAARATVGCLDSRTDGDWGDVRRLVGLVAFPGLAVVGVVVGVLVLRGARPWTLAAQPVVAVVLLVAYGALGHVSVTPSTVRLFGARLVPVGCPPGQVGACADDARLLLDVTGTADVGLRLTRDRPAPRTAEEIDRSIRAPIEPTYLPDVVGRRESTGRHAGADTRVYDLRSGRTTLLLRPRKDVDLDPANEPSAHTTAPLPRGRYVLTVVVRARDDPSSAGQRRELRFATR